MLIIYDIRRLVKYMKITPVKTHSCAPLILLVAALCTYPFTVAPQQK